MMKTSALALLMVFSTLLRFGAVRPGGEQPLERIAIHRATFAFEDSAYIRASPEILGSKGQNNGWVTLEYTHPSPSSDDWIGVFSPAKFRSSVCEPESGKEEAPLLCTSPIKFQYANYTSNGYRATGKGSLKLQLINQREDFSFALFSGGLSNPKLITVSNTVIFANPKAPVYPRLSQGKIWNEMVVTWTSGYGIDEAEPFVEWGPNGGEKRSPAGTLTISRNSMCGSPARTVGWRDPGFIHSSFLKDLWPNSMCIYSSSLKSLNYI